MYLKNWCDNNRKIHQYKNLVQHENVPIWKAFSPKAIGYAKHLYVDTKSGNANDDFENWFDLQFEYPAENAISKVLKNIKLTKSDYVKLTNFLALQDLRTPKRFLEYLQRTSNSALDEIVQNVVKDIPSSISANYRSDFNTRFHDELPLKILLKKDTDGFVVQASFLPGRASWLWSIKQLLTGVAADLHKNSWTILHPADGHYWLTSDNPVLKLYYNDDLNYHFNGGWRSIGSEIILPLGPRHLLYTKVGVSPPILRSTKLGIEETTNINQLIAKNSHRFVIAIEPFEQIQHYRPRTIDSNKIQREKTEWENFNNDQILAEKTFYK